ncbi:MAG: hypothetical protein H7Y38_19030 [Armatimonadetes bacterium]|nr:hypothetical protein [Armatimonadota bacterium]
MRSRFALTILVGFAVSVAGCNKPVPPNAAAVSDIPTVNRSASFAAVSASYRAGAYRDALRQVEALQKSPSLSAADRLYLQNQATICRQALTPSVGATPQQYAATTLPSPTPSASDCGAQALLFVCRENNVPASLSVLTKAAGTRPGVGSNLAGLSRAARTVGYDARGVQVDADALRRVKTPALAWVDGNHFVAVTAIEKDTATVYDSNKTGKEKIALDTLLARSGGIMLLLSRPSGANR